MLFALIALAGAPAAPAYPDPLAPAADGKMQCFAPTDHKTCASIASYVSGGNGSFANIAKVLLSADPPVVIRTTSQVTIRDGAVCGAVLREDITSGSLTVNGQPIPPDKATPVLQQIADQLTPIIGHEICSTYVPDGPGFISKATMDGKPQPDQDQKMIWISPGDGYTVAP
jgi:hypothetical protein